jgi:crossover junction endodeoxyribonuclease RuvC
MAAMMRSVAGIDLSLTSTGWSCNGVTESIASKNKGARRLFDIRSKILDLLVENDFPGVVLENYSFGSRASQAHALGELGGVVRVALYESGVPYVEVPPTSRAKFATGRGNAGKSEVVSSISARTGITWQGKGADDQCDAWILEEMGRCALGRQRFEWPKNHVEAMNKILWHELREYCE